MKHGRFRTFVSAAGIALVAAAPEPSLSEEAVTFYIPNAPPMTMDLAADEPNSHGFVADIVAEAARRAGIKLEMTVVPWRRAQNLVEQGDNLLIAPLSRVPERENLYNWVAPIFHFERAFATLDQRIDSYDDAKSKLKSILVGKGTAQELTLLGAGFPESQLHRHEINVGEADMLLAGRADGWFNGTAIMLWRWRKAGIRQPLVIGSTIDANDIYLACSKTCAPELMLRLKKSIDALKQDGTAKRIERLYLPD